MRNKKKHFETPDSKRHFANGLVIIYIIRTDFLLK